ncbi:sterol desaturase [Aspergillus bombycis]|uniref:Sterol desaturase n=1 Tax=Aspergillus bombycis TaxID=109264 RepID=A0A1F8ADH2_9EURO|nr:sterol desaturase [Aspergillus bombycis]OGM49398.1 sterol desaturase [Aspergillus bombycis]
MALLLADSVDYINIAWAELVKKHSPQQIELLGTFFTQISVFWSLSLLFLLLDLFGPLHVQRNKIQSSSRQPDRRLLWKAILVAALNQAFATTLHLGQIFIVRPLVPQLTGLRVDPWLPSAAEIMHGILWCTLGREALFYYGHRALHWPWLYRRFHKQHHLFTTPVAVASLYCHPVEHVVSNILPVAIPAHLLRIHVVTFWLFACGVSAQASWAHCGYRFFDFSFMGWKPEIHDLHHEKLNVNYGLIGILDAIHGTRATRRRYVSTGTSERVKIC